MDARPQANPHLAFPLFSVEQHGLQVVAPRLTPTKPTLAQIYALERELIARTEIHVELRVVHHFAPGIYCRELHIPAGTVLTGKVHRHEHMNQCEGDITVWTEDGMRRITGTAFLISAPGTKRVGYAHADTVWRTFHHNPTDTRDLEQIEAEHIIPEAIAMSRFEQLEAA